MEKQVRDSQSVLQPDTLIFPPINCSESSASPARILVVEDERFVRNAACEILNSAGYHALTARNAADAKNIFNQSEGQTDVLITDVVLPGQNGCELAAELKGLQPTIQTILISGYPCDLDLIDGMTENEMWYLPKPFSAEALLQKVGHVLAQRQAATVAKNVCGSE